MKTETPILPFRQSGSLADRLTHSAWEGARRMLAEALKVEADVCPGSCAAEQLEDDRQWSVQQGFWP